MRQFLFVNEGKSRAFKKSAFEAGLLGLAQFCTEKGRGCWFEARVL